MLSGTARDRERPATFRDVLVIGEFRAIYAASTLSWLGDYIARAAITALVYDLTGSVSASAAAFAISYTPWLLGGSVLVSLAERYPYRAVMVTCDVARMALMAVVALPLPPLVVLILLLCSALFAPPFDAARSAMLPTLLPGDRYVVGLGLHAATVQPAQVAGYLIGASLAGVNPRLALLINAGTFAASAGLTHFGVRLRPPALDRTRRTHLLRETVDGFHLVFSSRALRSIVLLVFCGSVFAVVPEGLGAAWAAGLADESDRGWVQGLIMAVVPLGAILGALTLTRLVSPDTRQNLLRPLAIAIPLILFPALFNPPVALVALLAGLASFAMGALVPIANGQFVRALPNAFRARAFGVVQAGLQVLQGAAVLITGIVAQQSQVPLVVGLWSMAGVGLMLALSLTWPPRRVFADAVTAAAVANADTAPAAPTTDSGPATADGGATADTTDLALAAAGAAEISDPDVAELAMNAAEAGTPVAGTDPADAGASAASADAEQSYLPRHSDEPSAEEASPAAPQESDESERGHSETGDSATSEVGPDAPATSGPRQRTAGRNGWMPSGPVPTGPLPNGPLPNGPGGNGTGSGTPASGTPVTGKPVTGAARTRGASRPPGTMEP